MSSLTQYDDQVILMRSHEWYTWVTFLNQRADGLETRAIQLIRDKKFEESVKVVAIADDIRKQVQMFNNQRAELEKELGKKEG